MDYAVLVKIVIVYFLVLIVMKFMGKREIGQLSLFDFVIILIIADIAVLGIETTEHPFWLYVLGIVLLAIIQKVIAKIILRFEKIRNLFDGVNSFMIIDGKINLKEMRKQSYNIDDLITQLRLKNIRSLSEVRYAILETNGEVSAFKFSDFKEGSGTSANAMHKTTNPVTLNKSSEMIDSNKEDGKLIYPFPLIISGAIVDRNLEVLGISEDWVEKEILKQGYKSFKEIYYANYENDGLFIIETCEF